MAWAVGAPSASETRILGRSSQRLVGTPKSPPSGLSGSIGFGGYSSPRVCRVYRVYGFYIAPKVDKAGWVSRAQRVYRLCWGFRAQSIYRVCWAYWVERVCRAYGADRAYWVFMVYAVRLGCLGFRV